MKRGLLIFNQFSNQLVILTPQEAQGTSSFHCHSHLHKHFLDVRCQCHRMLPESEKNSYEVCRRVQSMQQVILQRVTLKHLDTFESGMQLVCLLGFVKACCGRYHLDSQSLPRGFREGVFIRDSH